MGFSAKPNTRIDDTRINSIGFTGDVPEENTSESKIRILTLGGSAFFNRQMTEKLIKALNTETFNGKVKILGAALRMHTTVSSLIKYRYLRKYKFDYVLIYHNINDLWADKILRPQFERNEVFLNHSPWYKRGYLLENSLIARMVYNKLIHSPVYEKDEKQLRMNFDETYTLYSTHDLFKRNISKLVDMILEDGGIPVIMTFAWTIPENYTEEKFENKALGYNNPDNYDPCPVKFWGKVEYVKSGLIRNNQLLRDIALQKGIPIIDQEKLMGKDLANFGDVCHFSDIGTERFINNIKDFLLVLFPGRKQQELHKK